jgi:hypothetical protein
MAKPEWYDPTHPSLVGKEAKDAVTGQIGYTQMVRSQVDEPVNQQSFGLISLNLLKTPGKTTTGKPVYGFLKLRGNWADQDQAKMKAAGIIRDVDSKFKVLIAPVGRWIPITEETGSAEMVNVSDEEIKKEHEDAVRDAEKEANRIKKEIEEREKEVRDAKDYNDDKDSITYYTMKRNALMSNIETEVQFMKKLESIREAKMKTRHELEVMDKIHPQYREQWVDKMNEERKKAGIKSFEYTDQMRNEYESMISH